MADASRRIAGLGADMITLEDCIGFCDLTEEEVLAFAEHEHLPEIAAVALAQFLLSHEHGSEKVRNVIIEDTTHRLQRRESADVIACPASFPKSAS